MLLGRALSRRLDKQARTTLRSGVTALLETLAADLGLPGRLRLKLGQDQSIDGAFAVNINGQAARAPRRLSLAEEASLRHAALSITGVIYQNRALLVSLDMANYLRAQWAGVKNGVTLPGQSRQAFLEYLRMFTRSGFNLERGRCHDHWHEPAPEYWAAADCFEEAVRPMDALQVRVCHGPDFQPETFTGDDQSLQEMLDTMQSELFYELGVRFPLPHFQRDADLEANEFVVQINDVRLPPFEGLAQNEFLVDDTVERLKLLNIEGREAANPANGAQCAVVVETDGQRRACEQAGLTTWGQKGYVILGVRARLRQQAGAFVTRDTVEYDFDILRNAFPAVIDHIYKRFDVKLVVQVLRALVDEQLSFRNLREVLQALLAINASIAVDSGKYIVFAPYGRLPYTAREPRPLEALTAADYVRMVREHMKRYISHKYTRGASTLVVYLLDPALESRISECESRPLSAAERDSILDAVGEEVGTLPPTAQSPVILTTSEIRKALRDLIHMEFPHLAVLCYQELSPDMNIQPIARISL